MADNLWTFDWYVQFYSVPTQVEIVGNCNSIFVVNLSGVGGSIVTVNNYPLNPTLVPGANGENFMLGGNRGEIIKRKTLDLGFSTGVGLACVIQKYYVNIC